MSTLPLGMRPANPLRRLLAALEPWYDWGTINTSRMDARTEDECTEGDVYFFDVQWLGIHVGFQIGRTPGKREGCGIDRDALAQMRGESKAVLSPREDQHRAILASRNDALATVNGKGDFDEDDADRLIDSATDAENLICLMPATTVDGAAVKMLTLLQMAAIGHEVSDDMAWPIVEEAAALLGISTLADLGYPTPADQIAREAAAEARS